jgi:hypothetical protein
MLSNNNNGGGQTKNKGYFGHYKRDEDIWDLIDWLYTA